MCRPQSKRMCPSPPGASITQALQCGIPDHGQRQAQAPQAGDDPLAARLLTFGRWRRHRPPSYARTGTRPSPHGAWRDVAHAAESTADLWVLQGDPGHCNVYFLRSGDGVVMFDAGGKMMLEAVRDAARRSAGCTRSCSATATPTTAVRRLGSACRCAATPMPSPRRRGCGGWEYWDPKLRFLRILLRRRAPRAAPQGVGRRPGHDRRHRRGGRRDRGRLPGRRAARPRAGPDRAVACGRPGRADDRRVLRRRHVGPPRATACIPPRATRRIRRARGSRCSTSPTSSPRVCFAGHGAPVRAHAKLGTVADQLRPPPPERRRPRRVR